MNNQVNKQIIFNYIKSFYPVSEIVSFNFMSYGNVNVIFKISNDKHRIEIKLKSIEDYITTNRELLINEILYN